MSEPKAEAYSKLRNDLERVRGLSKSKPESKTEPACRKLAQQISEASSELANSGVALALLLLDEQNVTEAAAAVQLTKTFTDGASHRSQSLIRAAETVKNTERKNHRSSRTSR